MKIDFIKQKPKIWTAYNLAIFRVTAILFMILFIVDYFIPGVVTNWINPIYLLLIAILSGMLVVSQDAI